MLKKMTKIEEVSKENETLNKFQKEIEKKSTKAINFLDKFAFGSSPPEKSSEELVRPQPSGTVNRFRIKKLNQKRIRKKKTQESNLFVTQLGDDQGQVSDKG